MLLQHSLLPPWSDQQTQPQAVCVILRTLYVGYIFYPIALHWTFSGREIVLATFLHQRINYVIHVIGRSAVNAGWLHYSSFLTTTHRLERDEVRIFREGGTERTVREFYVAQNILMTHFKAGENPGTKLTTIELELRLIVKRLKHLQTHYWRYWIWQWWLLNAALHETTGIQEFIEVEVRPYWRRSGDMHTWRNMVCALFAFKTFADWIYSISIVAVDRGLPRLNDVFFVAIQTRSIWIILLTSYLSWCIHPKGRTLFVRFSPPFWLLGQFYWLKLST